MYEMIYSKRKTLKEDQRLTYFSYWSVCKYPELINLMVFSTLSTAASGINTNLTQPLTTDLEWPFAYYVYGISSGLIVLLLVSDFMFQQRMCFQPPLLYASISAFFHTAITIMALFYKEDLDRFEKRWIMFCEGFLDGNI